MIWCFKVQVDLKKQSKKRVALVAALFLFINHNNYS